MSARHRIPVPVALVAGAILCLALSACPATDRVAEARASHAVELLGFSVERVPGGPQTSPVDAARAAGAGGGGSAAGTPDENGGEAEARLFVADAATSTVRLKVKVRRVDAKFGLPGITVEAVLQDGETGDEKETYRVWLALGGPWSGGEQVVESKLPGVPYREGDTFDLTLRAQVPKVEQPLYREFAGR
jgi:hypothetical protein